MIRFFPLISYNNGPLPQYFLSIKLDTCDNTALDDTTCLAEPTRHGVDRQSTAICKKPGEADRLLYICIHNILIIL